MLKVSIYVLYSNLKFHHHWGSCRIMVTKTVIKDNSGLDVLVMKKEEFYLGEHFKLDIETSETWKRFGSGMTS